MYAAQQLHTYVHRPCPYIHTYIHEIKTDIHICVGISFVASTQLVFAHSPCWCSFSALTTFNQSGISFRIFFHWFHTHTKRPDSSLPFGLFLFICYIDHRFKEAKVFSIFHLYISNSVRFYIKIIIEKNVCVITFSCVVE